MKVIYTPMMIEAFYVCRQKFEEDPNTKKGEEEYLTIDDGWSDYKGYAAIFIYPHAEYKADIHARKFKFNGGRLTEFYIRPAE